jgi:SAM-dependent methyltransferase
MLEKNVLEILKCPDCSGDIGHDQDKLVCSVCLREFHLSEEGIIQMMPLAEKIKPEMYDDPNYVRWQQHSSEALEEYFESGNVLFKKIHDSAHSLVAQWSRAQSDAAWSIDVGCGTGYHYPYYDNLEKVIGIDFNLDSLRKIKKRHADAILIHADCCNVPLKDGLAGNIFSIYILEHIYYLENVLLEIQRLLSAGGKFFVGLPCEGGLAWNLGRKLTSERTLSRRYNIDYRKVIAIEHCNTVFKVVERLKEYFEIEKRQLFPLRFVPFFSFNLTVAMRLSKRH